ncbi:hypothetical protein OAF45_02410 [Candidatus Latescibacteria bacterium]|nr:hypothetical protein [Candidatus Latescibacterota bacterium]
MTVDERFEQLERKTQRLEKRNKRLTVALTMMAVVVCAVVTMAATGDKDGRFDKVMANAVMARYIYVTNDTGDIVVRLGATNGDGTVTTYQPNGKKLVGLGATDNGGMVAVLNKTGKIVVGMSPDEYGNGAVVASNLKGEVRTFHPDFRP